MTRIEIHDDYVHGYQLVPVNWGINTPRKRQFINLLAAMTGATV